MPSFFVLTLRKKEKICKKSPINPYELKFIFQHPLYILYNGEFFQVLTL